MGLLLTVIKGASPKSFETFKQYVFSEFSNDIRTTRVTKHFALQRVNVYL